MRVESLARLIEGELCTSPAISTIKGIAFTPESVKQGDIFVCKDRLEESLNLAIKRGAFALIVDKFFAITDKEIAWIRVDNLDMAMVRLARFFIAKNKIGAYYVTNFELTLAKSMNPPKSILILKDSLSTLLIEIFKENLSTLILSSNKTVLKKISPQYLLLPTPKESAIVLSNSTIFQSNFIFKDKLYQKLPLPPFWIESFVKLASLFDKLNWRFGSLKPLEHFVPIFIDKHLIIHPFGATRQAMVIESESDLFTMQVKYLNKYYPKIPIFTCAPLASNLDIKVDFSYEKVEDLLDLNPKTFRYALILGDLASIESLFVNRKHFKQNRLF